MIRDKNFYREFFILASALIFEQIVVLSVNLADNVMIGRYSETALSGVAAVNQIQFVLQQITYGISSGLIILASQYWGQKRVESIRRLTSIALCFELVIGIAMFALTTLLPEKCVGLFVKDTDVIAQGAQYLSVVRFSYIPFTLTVAFLGVMRSVEVVRLALASSLMGLIVNCSINYIFIFGRFGAPEMGVAGAAIGTLTARLLELLFVAGYVLLHDQKVKMRMIDLARIDVSLGSDFVCVTSPVVLQNGLWGIANALQSMILGHMATQAMTAYSISTTVYQLLNVASAGASTAASILIGRLIGRGDRKNLKRTVRTLQVLFPAIGAATSLSLFAVRTPFLSLYNISGATRMLANRFFLIRAGIMFTMSYQMPVNTGIIRGGGDTRFSMLLDLISIWGIVMPLSYFAAFRWGWSPAAVVLCLNSDQIFKCIPAAIRVNGYRWVRELARAEQREENTHEQ